MVVLKNNASAEELGILPPLPPQAPLPADAPRPSTEQAVTPHPSTEHAEVPEPEESAISKAKTIIDSPAAVLGVGPVAPPKRRIASRWQKAKFVFSPLIVAPLKVGVYGSLGFMALGAGAGALMSSMTIMGGVTIGAATGSFVIPPAVALTIAIGVCRSFGRMFVSRTRLADKLEIRRQKEVLKRNGIVRPRNRR